VIASAQQRYKNVSSFVFYYSGHGVLYGLPRLIPHGFSFVQLSQAPILEGMANQTIGVNEITQIGKEGGGPSLFVLDACRDQGPGDFFGKLYALEEQERLTNNRPTRMQLNGKGAFDGLTPEISVSQYLGRSNTLIMLAAVK